VPRLVEERMPVVGTPDRLDDEHDAAGNLDRGAEGARRLRRTRLDVEVDVLLRLEVDPEALERCLESGKHLLAGEARVPFAGAEDAGGVPAPPLPQAERASATDKR